MSGISFYRDERVPFFELKVCRAESVSYKKHYHEEYSLGLVESGASRVWHEGRQVEVFPASFVLIPPGVFHACNPRDKASWQYKMLFIQPGWVDEVSRDEAGYGQLGQGVRCLDGRAFRPLMATAAAALMGPATPLARESAVLALLDGVLAAGGAGARTVPAAREEGRVKRLREYLQEHFLAGVTLDDLATASGLSKFYIIKLFRREYGVPPHVYQTMLRVNFARQALRQRQPLAAVAQEAGFYDQSHFTKAFRSQVGITPEVYQRYYGGC